MEDFWELGRSVMLDDRSGLTDPTDNTKHWIVPCVPVRGATLRLPRANVAKYEKRLAALGLSWSKLASMNSYLRKTTFASAWGTEGSGMEIARVERFGGTGLGLAIEAVLALGSTAVLLDLKASPASSGPRAHGARGARAAAHAGDLRPDAGPAASQCAAARPAAVAAGPPRGESPRCPGDPRV